MTPPQWLLRAIFRLKGNFAPGLAPSRKTFDGVEIAPFLNAASAAVSISSDTELSWAFRGRSAACREQLAATERRNIPYILDLLAEFSVPITWATVGHLFLESCTRTGAVPHAGMPRPPLNRRWHGDWYAHDPCTDMERDPLWYAPDLVRQIAAAAPAHEIGSHTFSHIDFSSQTSTRELVTREMHASQAAMRPFGLEIKSLVYPFNNMGHEYLDILAGCGVIAVRHRDSRVRLSYPERTPFGVYKIIESMNLRSTDGYRYADKAEIFLDAASERTAAYHLWFHPSDPREVFQREFRDILAILHSRRARGELWVTTMRDLAGYCEARERVTLTYAASGATAILDVRSTLDARRYGAPDITLILPGAVAPAAIRQTMNGVTRDLSMDAVTTRSGGRVLINVPAADQTLAISFRASGYAAAPSAGRASA